MTVTLEGLTNAFFKERIFLFRARQTLISEDMILVEIRKVTIWKA